MYTGDTLSFIMDYENGQLESAEQLIDGFASMIASGMVWQLQGSYGRMARDLIEAGYISPEGEVLSYPEEM